jgi:hypothetical protein
MNTEKLLATGSSIADFPVGEVPVRKPALPRDTVARWTRCYRPAMHMRFAGVSAPFMCSRTRKLGMGIEAVQDLGSVRVAAGGNAAGRFALAASIF